MRRIAVTSENVIAQATTRDDARLQLIDANRHRPIGKPIKGGGAPTALIPNATGAIELQGLSTMLIFRNNDLTESYDVEISPEGVPVDLIDYKGAWVPVIDTHMLMAFDTTTGKRLARIPMPLKPAGVASDSEILWVACRMGFVQRVHMETKRKVGDQIETGPLLGPIDVTLGVAWAAGPSYVVRIENRDQLTEG